MFVSQTASTNRKLDRHKTRDDLYITRSLRMDPTYLDFLGRLGSPQRISSDGGVGVAIHLLHTIGSDPVLQEGAELLLIRLKKMMVMWLIYRFLDTRRRKTPR